MAESTVIYSTTPGKILCCLCGTQINPNAAAMCIDCLRSQHSITDDIERSLEILQCKKCNRWHNRLDQWLPHDLESTGLMTLCLKKIHALSKKDVKVIDCAWIWTEPHSRRLKLSVDIERGILDEKVLLRQRVIIEFVVIIRQCKDCAREETDHTWGALVQIRQNIGYKRSLIYLESLLVRNGLNELMIDVEVKKEGLDLYFHSKGHAERVADFISSNVPSRTKLSKKLISHNSHSNTAKHELTYCVEIASLVKDDLIVTTKEMTGSADLMLVTKISSSIHLINPFTLAKYEMNALKYFTTSPAPMLSSKQLETFVVLDIDKVSSATVEGVWSLAEAEIMKESDLGSNDTSYRVLTHLGNYLQAGDTVLGYDIRHSVGIDESVEKLRFECPDIILVRKTYPEKNTNKRKSKAKKGRGKKSSSNAAAAVETIDDGHLSVEGTEPTDIDTEEPDNMVDKETDGAEVETSLSWVDHSDEEYRLYLQQLHDEEELVNDQKRISKGP